MKLFELLLQLLQQFFSKPQEQPKSEVKVETTIDWSDINSPLGRHFKVKDAIWLPQWNRAATEEDGLTEEIKNNLIETFSKLDTIRDYIGKPIKVHVAFRSTEYNALVKGAKASSHLLGKAIDWSAHMGEDSLGADCDKIKELLEPCLEEWKLRLEDNGLGATWIHIDTAKVISKRYFKP